MDDARTQVETLLAEEQRLWYGPQQRAVIDEAVALADEIGDEDLQFKARMALTNCAVMTGDTDAQLSSFAWCLAKNDQDPARFAGSPRGDVLWHYKWAIDALVGSPIFSRSQIEVALDDMEAHYRQANAGLQGVLWARWHYADNTGLIDQAKDLHRQFLATPRDRYSNCAACTRSGLAGFAVSVGDEAEALRLVDEIINGDYEGPHSCAEEPERALSKVLEPMLHAGQFDEARVAHLRSYRMARTNPNLIDEAARQYQDAGMPDRAAEMLVNEANLYASYNQNEVALEILQRALVLAETVDNQLVLPGVLDRLGLVKTKTGDATGLDDLDRAEQLARAGQNKHNVAAVLDTRVGAFEHLGRPTEAISAALTGADAYMEADEPNFAARLEYIAGQFLNDQKDVTGAAAILRTALDHANLAIERGTNATGLRKAIALKLGDVYEALGDTAAAAETRAQAD
ncbi:MAG: hypothetical protein FWF36_07015 [Propionibacteriaceae bacterium]|nr:hypothetical protein [Propionibacteriaceae bacterium]